jgi:hypothetical protein
VIHYATDGSSGSYTQVTGKTDCVDELEVLEEDKLSDKVGNIDPAELSFLDTAVAYDSINERFLVGYITDCGNAYFRARTVKLTSGGFDVYGVDGDTVFLPPFEIADSASGPMLAFDDDFDSEGGLFLAAYGADERVTHGPADDPIVRLTRTMLYGQFVTADGRPVLDSPMRILPDDTEYMSLMYPSFLAGDIAIEAERDIFYLAWSQERHVFLCKNAWEPHDADWVCDLDEEEGEKIEEPEGFFARIDSLP